jgi:transcriptional regulator with XRE-family HTH domain
MLHVYFKQTMERFGVKGAKLAAAFGCSRNHISEIRMGKCNPPIDRFWELLEMTDQLAPGAKEYFGDLISGRRQALEGMEDADLGKLYLEIGEEMAKRLQKSSKNTVVRVPLEV